MLYQLQTIDKRLQKIKPPDFIVWLPRSLAANLNHLKGNCISVLDLWVNQNKNLNTPGIM